MEATFIEKGYSNWKDAVSNNRGFKLHESSNCHRVSVETVYALPRTTNDVADLLSKKHAAEKEIAKKPLLKILSNVRFLARQPFRFEDKELEKKTRTLTNYTICVLRITKSSTNG